MIKLFTSPDTAEVDLVKNMLANVGIVCEVRNGEMSQIVPAPAFYAELWVSEEAYPKAAEVVASWRKPAISSASWTCPACGERLEGQFNSCWKCGAKREGVTES